MLSDKPMHSAPSSLVDSRKSQGIVAAAGAPRTKVPRQLLRMNTEEAHEECFRQADSSSSSASFLAGTSSDLSESNVGDIIPVINSRSSVMLDQPLWKSNSDEEMMTEMPR